MCRVLISVAIEGCPRLVSCCMVRTHKASDEYLNRCCVQDGWLQQKQWAALEQHATTLADVNSIAQEAVHA